LEAYLPALNFTLQDIFGTCLAFLLFVIVMVFPGYVTAWVFDLFDFRKRLRLTQFSIAIIISFAVSPILVYLLYRLVSSAFTIMVLGIFAAAFAAIIINQAIKQKSTRNPAQPVRRYKVLTIAVITGWLIFAVLSLVDIQWNDRLYYNEVSYDYTTRAAVIGAVTRTGVPPVNPSYFPGHPQYLTFLYYFWYILCSIIDRLGADLVDARMAMIASVLWCGLGLMAAIAFYLRLRNGVSAEKAWKLALLGIGFLLISGLDFIPALTNMASSRLSLGQTYPAGDIEQWNEQITAWVGSIFWVPHHVAGMIACLTGLMLLQFSRDKSLARQIPAMFITGLAFASAVGLSTWVTLVFAAFWGIWIIKLLAGKKEIRLAGLMVFAGIIAILAASPFLAGALQGDSSISGSAPVVLEVRRFGPAILRVDSLPFLLKNIVYFLLLPINYAMELGFFFFTGILWAQYYKKKKWHNHAFITPEIILLCVVVVAGSIIRSEVIGSNDFGWRCWLLGQFVLLVWAVDVFGQFLTRNDSQSITLVSLIKTLKAQRLLTLLLLLGLFTTVVDVTLLRTWPILADMGIAGFPNSVTPDTRLGQRTLAARQAYAYIQKNLAEKTVIQHNPTRAGDRPAGLYGTRQMAISDHTVYGISNGEYQDLVGQVGEIFSEEDIETWDAIDQDCEKHFINVIVVNDLDPLWKSLPGLEQLRPPLYKNMFYAILNCGKPSEFLSAID
jgi:hypothetical protein